MSKAIYKNEYIHILLRHIENNLSAVLDTDLLSSTGYVSRAKLYYDFYSMSGHSVKEYVRKRRLSNALALIKTSDKNLTDIAFQCGYSSYLTLWRTVRQTLGLTPSEYKNSDTYYFFPPFNGEPLQSVTVSNETIPQMIRIVFYHSRLANIENIAVNNFLQVYPDYSGRIFGRNGKQEGSKFCYELYLTDTGINYTALNEYGFKKMQEIPCFSATFATSTVPNDECKINTAWGYLYSDWLQNSMFEYTDEPYFEEYILKNGRPTKLKLYLPIKERGEETKIRLINNPKLCFIAAEAKGYNAEKIASQAVFDYLTVHYPYIVIASSKFFVHKEDNSYVCGVCVSSELGFKENKNIIRISTKHNNYLVLESSVMGDYDRYTESLLSFAYNNGMDADKKDVFAVYDANESFTNLKIKMYCPVKLYTK